MHTQIRSVRNRSVAALLVIITTAIAGLPRAALAANTETVTQNVSTADLNLASPQGEAELNRRIALAVRAVCGTSDGRELGSSTDVSACRAVAIREAHQSAKRLVADALRSTEASNTRSRAAARS